MTVAVRVTVSSAMVGSVTTPASVMIVLLLLLQVMVELLSPVVVRCRSPASVTVSGTVRAAASLATASSSGSMVGLVPPCQVKMG